MMNYDNRLRHFSEQLNKLTFYVKLKKIMHLHQMTLHDMFKQQCMKPNFCHKICTLKWDAFLKGCVLKWEISVCT